MSRWRKIVFWSAIVVMVLSGGFVAVQIGSVAYNAQVYKELPEKVTNLELPSDIGPADPEDGSATEAIAEPPEEPYVSPIDFEQLWDINEDIYAWIDIPGMDISYPIVQHPTDDDYYLHYTIEGNKGLPGSIYTEPSVNSKDFSDFNTIIYGHHAKNGLMFSNLVKYRDSAVLEANRDIVIYTPDAEYHYKIFAAELFGNEYIPSSFPCNTAISRQIYLNVLAGVRDMNSYYLNDVDVTPDSHIITLSTCTGVSANRVTNRYLVVAVLEDQLPAAESA